MTVIASWNINSVRIRIDLIEKLIKEIHPDIILFQEIKCTNEDFPDFYSSLNYKAIINGQKGKYGVAILLKKDLDFVPIKVDEEILLKESRINFIYIKKLDLNILNVYAPNGNPIENKEKFNFKMLWYSELKKISKDYVDSMKNLLVAGDFNVLENEEDVKKFDGWEKDALGCYETRKKFRDILSIGLTNLVRIFKKPGEIFSYWDYQRGCWERNDGLLIDHFLVSPRFLRFVKNINFEPKYRGMQKPSDHIPIWISLNI